MIKQATRRKGAARQQIALPASIPAPVLGWNAQDSLAGMKPDYAVILDNWIPRASYVEIRRGSKNQISGLTEPVETLMAYRGDPSGIDQLYAVADDSIYDASTAGAAGTPVVTGLTSARFQYTNFANDGGAWLYAVNGADDPYLYDGSSWTNPTITGSSGTVTLDKADLIDVMPHKRRLFFVEKNTKRVWYLGTNAIQGGANLLDLGPVFQQGGVILCQGTWSLDGGQGQDDYAVWVTTEGEVAVYQGTDPDNDNEWSLVGVFSIGRPLGRRALFKFGGDLQILTTNGVFPLSQALGFDRGQQNNVAVTAKIQNAFSVATQQHFSKFGWQGITYQQGSLAIYNIPIDELTTSHQYVQNLQTGAWCRFTGLNAYCWEIYNGGIYFGTSDGVYQWDNGVTDSGNDLIADMKTAFNYFGRRGTQKKFNMIRPILNATADVSPAIEMLTDFVERDPIATPITTVSSSSDLAIRANWTSTAAIGYCGAVRAQVKLSVDPDLIAAVAVGDGNTVGTGGGDTLVVGSVDSLDNSQIQAISFDILYEQGGQL